MTGMTFQVDMTTLYKYQTVKTCCLLCLTGGLSAVIWTDFIQTIIMLIGAVYLMIVSEFTELPLFISLQPFT